MLHARSLVASRLSRVLLPGALFLSCAQGVEPDLDGTGEPNGESGSGGGMPEPTAGTGNGGSGTGQAGKANGGSGTNPFGGTSSTAGTGTAGEDSGGTGGSAGGSGSMAGAGTGGSAGGTGGASGSGGSGGGDGCGCAKTLAWMDNTPMNWSTGDCLTTGGMTYRYTGTKAQTYANAQCKPGMQELWCADMGNDYKFMLCP